MKIRFSTRQALACLGLLITLTVGVTVLAQMRTADIQPCRAPQTHFEAWQRFRSLPVKFTEVKDDTAYWKFEDPTGVYIGSFHLEKNTAFFNEKFEKKDRLYFEFNLKDQWGVNYDSECFSVISVSQIKSQP